MTVLSTSAHIISIWYTEVDTDWSLIKNTTEEKNLFTLIQNVHIITSDQRTRKIFKITCRTKLQS